MGERCRRVSSEWEGVAEASAPRRLGQALPLRCAAVRAKEHRRHPRGREREEGSEEWNHGALDLGGAEAEARSRARIRPREGAWGVRGGVRGTSQERRREGVAATWAVGARLVTRVHECGVGR